MIALIKLADIYSVIGYYLRHKTEVYNYLKISQQRAAEVRQENERRFNPIGIRDTATPRYRERLLARQSQQKLC